MSKDDVFQYEASLKVYRDNYAVMKTAIDDAKAEEKREIAQNMKKDGVDSQTIAKYTGLSLEEVERLK